MIAKIFRHPVWTYCYSSFKGSVLGPEEFLQGLGIGLKSFLGGTVGEHYMDVCLVLLE